MSHFQCNFFPGQCFFLHLFIKRYFSHVRLKEKMFCLLYFTCPALFFRCGAFFALRGVLRPFFPLRVYWGHFSLKTPERGHSGPRIAMPGSRTEEKRQGRKKAWTFIQEEKKTPVKKLTLKKKKRQNFDTKPPIWPFDHKQSVSRFFISRHIVQYNNGEKIIVQVRTNYKLCQFL